MHPLIRLMQALTSILATLAIVLTLTCVGGGLAVVSGAAPPFNWKFPTYGQYFLTVHNGPNGSACPATAASWACSHRTPERHEFYAHYVTPHQVRLLTSFELPER